MTDLNALFLGLARPVACRRVGAALALALSACASAPPAPDWQVSAKGATERATAAYLEGNLRVADAEFDKARQELARTGRPEVLALAELLRCAGQVASLELEPCARFDALRPDATAPVLAYADYLAGRVLTPQDLALLPQAQRAVAVAGTNEAALGAITDPLSLLVASGVLFQTGRASPAVVALAVDTASAQGWRRPLLAWLGVQLRLAEQAGQMQEAARIGRRVDLVRGAR